MTPRHLSKSAFQAKHSNLFSAPNQSSLPFVTRQGAGHVFLHLHAHCPLSVCRPHSHMLQEIGLLYFSSLPPSLLTLDVSSGDLSSSASSWGSNVPYTLSLPMLSPSIPFFTVGCNYQCRCLNLWTRQLAFGLLSIHFPFPWHFGFLGDCHPPHPLGLMQQCACDPLSAGRHVPSLASLQGQC